MKNTITSNFYYKRFQFSNHLDYRNNQLCWNITDDFVGFVKLNVDASFGQDLLSCMGGAFRRDDKGKFIDGGNLRIDWCADVLTAEVLALRFGLSLEQKGVLESSRYELL